jgi:hypothetical protein
MKKITILLSILFLFAIPSLYSQQQSVLKGTVTDTISKQNLSNAVITLLRSKDSVLVKFVRTDANGFFEVKNVQTGVYVMMVTYPNYVEMIDTISLNAARPRDMGRVILNTRAHILQEVVVRQTIAPIRVKGDTTEYLADSFKVKPGATVEDLLKVMPGFTINSKGEVTAQGQRVQKVLVDGDEFFGDDPTMATQNLNAKDVAKVQVYEKKSDQATLTGIDDGQKQQTVNLIMKDDAKKGYFGRVEAGTDFSNYYKSKATASRFTSTLKAGGYIQADRTGRNGMSWEDAQDFGNVTTVMDGGMMYMSSEGDDFSSYNTQGIPENFQVAAMLNKKYGPLKSSTATNYSYNHQNLVGNSNTNTTYILPEINYNYLAQSNKSTRLKHTVSTKNEIKIDSASTLTINARGTWGKGSSASESHGEYLNGKRDTVNTSRRLNTSSNDNSSLKADIFYNRKFNKSGTRSLTVSGGYGKNTSNSDGFLLNETIYYTGTTPNQSVDQRKIGDNQSHNAQALVSYTEPLGKKTSLNLNYTFNNSYSDQDSRSYEKKAGKYDSLNLLFSNHYQFTNSSNRAGAAFNYITKKVTLKAGLAVQDLSLKQTNVYKDSSYARNFTNFFPTANFRWKYSQSGNLTVNYSGNTQQPSLTQLQPIVNNIDPLNQTIGNPDLKPSFNHNFSAFMNDYKVLTNRGIWAYGNLTFTENAFSSRSVVDSLGRRVNQTVNISGNFSYNMQLEYNRQIKFMKLEVGVSTGVNGNRYTNFVNGNENTTKSFSVTPGVSLGRSIEKKMYARMRYSPTFSQSATSINTNTVTEYWTQTLGIYLDYKFPMDFSFNTNFDANFRQKLYPTDPSTNSIIWNAAIEKKISKKKDLTAIISVNDILNQNLGFSRNISSNYQSENTYTTVQRYFLLSFMWKFNKNRKVNED